MTATDKVILLLGLFYLTTRTHGLPLLFLAVLLKCADVLLTPYLVWLSTQKRSNRNIRVVTAAGVESLGEYLGKHSHLIDDRSSSVDLTVLVPAYNEEGRIRPMLKETIESLTDKRVAFEVIVINDCSRDNTTQVVKEFFREHLDIKVVEYDQNRGKGGAIRLGGLLAKGRSVLMADADGATNFKDYYKLQSLLTPMGSNGLVIGSRHHLNAEVQRSFLRDILAKVYNILLSTVCGLTFRDTQCGFKLFTKSTARTVFSVQHLERWAFDVELIMIAQHLDIEVQETPVNWTEIDGSHLNVFEASFTMLRDFLMLRVLYMTRLWKFSDRYFLEEEKNRHQ